MLASGVAEHRTIAAIVSSVLVTAVVTALVYLLEGLAPTLSLGALYVLAVMPIALFFGRAWAIVVSVASMIVFNFVFIPPTFRLTLHGAENWLVFGVYVVTGLLVSDLATRARTRAREAEQREREAAMLAELSTTLLSGATVRSELSRIDEATARVMRLRSARIVLDSESSTRPSGGIELRAGDHLLGVLVVPDDASPDPGVCDRFVPALAAVLGFALDRERFGHEALEAEALRRSDALKTALLRSVSHDLRSPLTAIRAALEGLESPSLALDEEQRAALVHSALLEAGRLDRMVRNLLDLSRLEAGAARPRLRLEPVEGLLERALAQIPAPQRRIDVSLPPELPLVEVDAIQLERALANLLENALKFSPPDERVRVDVDVQGRDVTLRVIDRGPGLGAGEWEQVFEPFRRGSAGASRQGAGLGLAIAQGFVEANGGRLWAEPGPSGGSIFAIAIPQAQQPVAVAL